MALLIAKKVLSPTDALASQTGVVQNTSTQSSVNVSTSTPASALVPVKDVRSTTTLSTNQSPDWRLMVRQKSVEYGVSESVMWYIINHESAGSTTIQSNYYWHGKREESYGLVQINLPSNPTVSYEEATDPEFSLTFLASRLALGHGYLWTTYRNLTAASTSPSV